MPMLIGVLMLSLGLGALIMAITGTQGQVFAAITGHTAPSPQSSSGTGNAPGGVTQPNSGVGPGNPNTTCPVGTHPVRLGLITVCVQDTAL